MDPIDPSATRLWDTFNLCADQSHKSYVTFMIILSDPDKTAKNILLTIFEILERIQMNYFYDLAFGES